jgi:hypothetical protein
MHELIEKDESQKEIPKRLLELLPVRNRKKTAKQSK